MVLKILYVTTPIYYVNDKPHLGHFYTTVAADILARFGRALGNPTKFLTGTDEHGAKVAQAAAAKGIAPQAYVDEMVVLFKDMVDYACASPDDFIRTTQPCHYRAAQALWEALEEAGDIYLGSYAGWYAMQDEAYYSEDELVQGPDGKRAPTGARVEWVEEPCYFFRLSRWQEPLLAYYQDHPEAIAPLSRYNETLSFIQSGLKDLAISRSKLSWGVPVPGHPGHVMYVWIDALTNYITALGYPEATPEMNQFWPRVVHLVGKDILRFHTVYWPAFLMSAGIRPPARVFAHGWWTRDGKKMSKSVGNVVDPKELVATYGVDPVRYFLFRHIRFGHDGDFSDSLFIQCVNQDLADGLGNLAHRTLSFLQSHTRRQIPALGDELTDEGKELLTWGQSILPHMAELIAHQDIYGYLDEVIHIIQKGNRYITHLAPWVLAKQAMQGDDQAREVMETGLSVILHLLRDLALLLGPIMPGSCQKLLEQLGQPKGGFSHIGTSLVREVPLPSPQPLFKKIESLKSLS